MNNKLPLPAISVSVFYPVPVDIPQSFTFQSHLATLNSHILHSDEFCHHRFDLFNKTRVCVMSFVLLRNYPDGVESYRSHSSRSGFRCGFATESAIDLPCKMNRERVTLLTLLDLLAAVDINPHGYPLGCLGRSWEHCGAAVSFLFCWVDLRMWC